MLLRRWNLWNRPAGYTACLLLLAILATLSWRQSRMYADLETLYRVTIDRNPDCWMANYNLGVFLADHQRFDEAEVQFQLALKNPDCSMAHYNRGVFLADHQRFDEAEVQFRQALEIREDAKRTTTLALRWPIGADSTRRSHSIGKP